MTLELDLDLPDQHAQWRLARVELVNWGTFDGHHTVDVAREGHLFTGASGSGKSSILDAIAAVLTPDRYITFNAAALDQAGGREDRSLISYVRGAWSKEADELEDRTVAAYLRPGATWSGILLRFEDLAAEPVTLVRLFHARGTGTDRKSLSDACVITRSRESLLDYRDHAARGIEVRRIKADLDPVVVTSAGSHGGFYARLRTLLGISSDNALKLLHKTQAAKNLGTLDTLFRQFMLDEPRTFERADNAVEQFGELREAYEHVVDLRRQRDQLRLAADAAAAYEEAAATVAEAERLAELVQPYADQVKRDLAEHALHDAEVAVATTAQDRERARGAAGEGHDAWVAAQMAAARVGGNDATHLRKRIGEADARVAEVTDEHTRFAGRLSATGIALPATAAEFAELAVAARRELDAPPPPPVAYDLQDASATARREVAALEKELDALRHRRSNMDANLLRLRECIAAEVGVPEAALPFAGELIDVREDQSAWTGAIERVLAPIATALLVPADTIGAVRRFIDGRHLGVRLVLEEVPLEVEAPPKVRDASSVVHKVTVADGPFSAYLNRRLSRDFDVACVDGPDALARVQRGVTVAGLYKRSAHRYEKDDRRAVGDRATWVLGGNNNAKVEVLQERLGQARRELADRQDEVDAAGRARDAVLARRRTLEEITDTDFARLDVAAAQGRVAALRAELETLVRPDSDLDRAMQAEAEAKAGYDAVQAAASRAESAHLAALHEQQRLAGILAEVAHAAPLDPADADAIDRRFTAVRRSRSIDTIDRTATEVGAALAREAKAAHAAAQSASTRFAAQAATYTTTWPAQGADLAADIEDRDGFRALHDGIVARGLPDHEKNFLRLLRERSRDTLIHLRDEIMGAPRSVERRIDPVNASLLRSEFDEGSHLEIRVKTRRSGEVEEFLTDLRAVVDGGFAEDSLAAAEKRFQVLTRVMARLGSSQSADRAWRRRVLDTREHVSFLARELEENGDVRSVHDSSAGLSGGQRQRLVVFCLAAALRYQLTTEEHTVPRYGTIILDEAFDKSDSTYTRMAMDIFREFGFHMVLATPQKLLQTLEPYLGAVTSVSNPTRRASGMAHVRFESAYA
ncbi:ATP-binding protein [Demequina silvatica]|uniref:ATP-binding protein n=1 Tax=Demequina silvatica TaxID=1638988 RepID=UPI000785B9BC|nr:SbcC/MukB-like Walker B domain-containing protein [Demequina silvatica]